MLYKQKTRAYHTFPAGLSKGIYLNLLKRITLTVRMPVFILCAPYDIGSRMKVSYRQL